MKRPSCFNFIWLLLLVCLTAAGCSSPEEPPAGTTAAPAKQTGIKETGALRDSRPQVLVPEASGLVTYASDTAAADASHTSEGYIMVRYTGSNQKVKLQIISPTSVKYTYVIHSRTDYETFPLTEGSGEYQFTVYENLNGDQYAAVLSQTIQVEIADEFKPFLYPNQYTNFTADSKAVSLSEQLADGAHSDLEVVTNIYNYVIGSISYDEALAENAPYDYLPDVDEVLSDQTGICFDYAAVMTAMLRAQRIPTKLVVGYSSDLYHAWISTYVDDQGWVDNVIQFDGKVWTLMDPTLAANNDAEDVKKYVGGGSNYIVKYTY